MLFPHQRLSPRRCAFPPRSLTHILGVFLISPVRATYAAHFVILDLMTVIIFGEE
jgi:hypothetical protein